MALAADITTPVAWWKEPSREQWHAWIAAWLGWVLDAFDFTIFLLIMAPIAKDFDVPLVEVTAVFTITLWMRLLGATASGWLADRVGRKLPLMISIAWYSVANLLAGLAPSFWLLFLFRAARHRHGRRRLAARFAFDVGRQPSWFTEFRQDPECATYRG